MRRRLLIATLVLTAALASCSRAPSGPKWPELVPADVARRAVEQYDANHDGKIDAGELERSPALKLALQTADADHDGALSRDEIVCRAEQWLKSKTVVLASSLIIERDGQPLEGATVTLEPEACMGPAYERTGAVTDDNGRCSPPGNDPRFPGLHLGLYRVKVSKVVDGKETIPARYNDQTVLGLEAAPDIRRERPIPVFHLKSR